MCEVEDIQIIGEANLADSIRDVVSRLPDDVSSWVVENITFIDFTSVSGLACHVALFPSEHRCQAPLGDIRLLIIVTEQKDDSQDDVLHRIAHEIAHHWLGHHEGSAKDLAGYESQEVAADSLANSWGFPGVGTRLNR